MVVVQIRDILSLTQNLNFELFSSIKSFTINAAVNKNPEAVKLSYPIANELKDRVGLNIINKKIRKEYFFRRVRDN